MKSILALALVALAMAGCATEEKKPAPAPVACKPAPTELLTQDLQPGTGDAVRFRSAILVSYTGWLYDGCAKDLKGAKFDSSEGRVTPFGFIVGAGRVIRGWDEGVIGMKEGGKRLLVIPSDKAYGVAGTPPRIPPNAALVFEISLIRIVAQPQ
ncbi:MAG TPA: FKBP-type peptidyl-prolyl cis-trans isomerase [Usitatibacter sp.]|nr:FKBP-type peptidyl-prolyl cis-trans isomerase [Usitatibacter sp.]